METAAEAQVSKDNIEKYSNGFIMMHYRNLLHQRYNLNTTYKRGWFKIQPFWAQAWEHRMILSGFQGSSKKGSISRGPFGTTFESFFGSLLTPPRDKKWSIKGLFEMFVRTTWDTFRDPRKQAHTTQFNEPHLMHIDIYNSARRNARSVWISAVPGLPGAACQTPQSDSARNCLQLFPFWHLHSGLFRQLEDLSEPLLKSSPAPRAFRRVR